MIKEKNRIHENMNIFTINQLKRIIENINECKWNFWKESISELKIGQYTNDYVNLLYMKKINYANVKF